MKNDEIFLRVGGVVAVIAGIGGMISNALHPRPPQKTDELLTLVASMPCGRHDLADMARRGNAAQR